MKKITLLSLLVICFATAKSQCSSIYGMSSNTPDHSFSLVAVDRFTGTVLTRDTIFSLKTLIDGISAIIPDSSQYITTGFDTSSVSHRRIYTTNFNTGQVLYQPICDSELSDLHYDIIRKKIYALMQRGVSPYQWSLVTVNPYDGSLDILDSIAGMRTLYAETSTIGMDSAKYYVIGVDGVGSKWLYVLDEATGHTDYKVPLTTYIFECCYDTISKSIYGLSDTGSYPYTVLFNSLNPTTGVVTPISTIPGQEIIYAFTSGFAQDSSNYFFVSRTLDSEHFFTVSVPSGNIIRNPVVGDSGTIVFIGTEYDPCNASYCTNTYNEPLCVATVDTATGKAEVIWGHTNSPPATGSYNIYRNTGSGYMLLHNQSLNTLSEFIDTSSNPSLAPVGYQLSTLDSCCESALSSPNTTMYLDITSGLNVYHLNWTAYVGFTPTLYRIFRGASMHSLVQIDSVANTVLTFHDTLPPLGSFYAIEAVSPFGVCTPTTHSAITHSPLLSGSFSNGFNTGTLVTATNEVKSENLVVSIYPNPSNGTFNIRWSVPALMTGSDGVSGQGSDIQISVIDELGQVVYAENRNNHIGLNTEQLNLENLASGVYTLRMQTNGGITMKKLVVMKK